MNYLSTELQIQVFDEKEEHTEAISFSEAWQRSRQSKYLTQSSPTQEQFFVAREYTFFTTSPT